MFQQQNIYLVNCKYKALNTMVLNNTQDKYVGFFNKKIKPLILNKSNHNKFNLVLTTNRI